jgi:hypothetical protein
MMHFLPRMPGALRACLLILAALWAHVAWAATTEVTDALGRKVKITTPVQRVVINFNYEEFTAVAGASAWSKVVGMSRTPWEGWRPGHLQALRRRDPRTCRRCRMSGTPTRAPSAPRRSSR